MPSRDEKELAEFCDRWKRQVFTFCHALLADQRSAEEATSDALVNFLRHKTDEFDEKTVPPKLFACAMQAVQKYGSANNRNLHGAPPLLAAMHKLPLRERAVVTMRNMLHMDWSAIGGSLGLSPTRVHEVWKNGVMQLTDFLQNDFAKEFSR